jgi:adenylyl-sulfate kinase
MVGDSAKNVPGFVVWITGLSGAGKTTLASKLKEALCQKAQSVEVLDGDEIRQHLSNDLGFTRKDRETNVRRVGYIARLLSCHGVIVIAAMISPYQTIREEVRASCGGRFVEVYLKCSMEVLVQRDSKGLYRKALQGEIENFTGVSDPYEEPVCPELVLRTDQYSPEACLEMVLSRLETLGYLHLHT